MQKITVITGGSRGLGRNTALSVARQSGDVIVTYQSRSEEAQTVVSEIQAMGRKAAALPLNVGEVSSFPAFTDALRKLLEER